MTPVDVCNYWVRRTAEIQERLRKEREALAEGSISL